MASKSLGTLTVDLIAKIGGFVAGMTEAEKVAEKASKKILADQKRMAAKIDKVYQGISAGLTKAFQVGFVGVTAAVGAGMANVVSQLEKAKNIEVFSGLAQMTTDEFQRMGFAAETVNIPMEKLADMMKDFNEKLGEFKAIGSGGFADFFKEIAPFVKITADELMKLSGKDALLAVVASMEEAGMSSREMSFYLESLGSDMTNLLPLLVDGGKKLNDLGQEASDAGAIMDGDFLIASKNAQEELNKLNWQVEGVRNELAIQFIPVLQQMINTLNDPAAKEGIATIVSGLGQIATTAINTATQLANFTKWLGEALAFKTNGGFAAAGDTVRAEKAVADTKEKLRGLQNQATAVSASIKASQSGVFGIFRLTEPLQERALNNLKRQIAEQNKKLKVQQEIVRMSYAENAATAKDGEQKRKAAKEQIDLIEAQKKAAEAVFAQRRKEYDAARAQRDAEAKAAKGKKGGGASKEKKEEKSDAAKKIEEMNKAYLDLKASMEERLWMLGKEGEVAQLTYDTQLGKYKEMTAAHKEELLVQAAALEQKEKIAEADKQQKEERERNNENAKELLLDLEHQMLLLGKTADEQERLNMLRSMGTNIDKEYIETAQQRLSELQKASKEMNQQIEIADTMRGAFSNAIEGIIDGTMSLKDAFKSFFDDLNKQILKMIINNMTTSMFGEAGSGFGGSTGGFFQGLFGGGSGGGGGGGMFSGLFSGLFGGGMAVGGIVQPNSMYRVNEIGAEMLSIKGKDYLMMGSSGGTITPNHKLGGGGGRGIMQNNNFVINGKIDRRTELQISQEVGRRAQIAQNRNH